MWRTYAALSAADSRIGHPFLFPGVGYGGSCFPKDIRALLKTARDIGVKLELIEAIERVNETQKVYLVSKIRDHFGDGLRGKCLAVWGLAFKPRTDDMREAPALALIHALIDEGVSVRVYDPEAMDEARRHLASVEGSVTYCRKSYEACDSADGLVLVTEWNEFREPDFVRIRDLLRKPVIFDGRRHLQSRQAERSRVLLFRRGASLTWPRSSSLGAPAMSAPIR